MEQDGSRQTKSGWDCCQGRYEEFGPVSRGISGERKSLRQLDNLSLPGKMAVKTVCVCIFLFVSLSLFIVL